jgi:hypothetical protein
MPGPFPPSALGSASQVWMPDSCGPACPLAAGSRSEWVIPAPRHQIHAPRLDRWNVPSRVAVIDRAGEQ